MIDEKSHQLYMSMINFQIDNEQLVELHEKSDNYSYDYLTELLTQHFPEWRMEKGLGSSAVYFLLEKLDEIENAYVDEELGSSIPNEDYAAYTKLQFEEVKEDILNEYEGQHRYYQHFRRERHLEEFESDFFLTHNPDNYNEAEYESEFAKYLSAFDEQVTVCF